MMKKEFLDLIAYENMPEEDWQDIHTVYQWHPAISDAIGKTEIVLLYETFGMMVIWDMLPRAVEAARIYKKKMDKEAELETIRNEAKHLERSRVVPGIGLEEDPNA